MTSLVSWVGVDSRGPTSAYIACDSRFSWSHPAGRVDTWDGGRKTFASTRYPDVAGYWGDVLFPVVDLSQFFSALDGGAVGASAASTGLGRAAAFEEHLRVALGGVPPAQRRDFCVLYIARESEGMQSSFLIRTLAWSESTGWVRRDYATPTSSAVVRFGGSGGVPTRTALAQWSESTEGGTSRAVFSAFVDGLLAGSDPLSGGGPQLVGIYRAGSGRSFGIVVGAKRFLHGAPQLRDPGSDELEWRNELFERVSGATKTLLPGAHRHVRAAP